LNSPWGMTIAPDDFGRFGEALLVGNFGNSHVNAFKLENGHFLGQLQDTHGQPLVLNGGFHGPNNKGLWGIEFGNGRGGAGRHTLFFATGINDEQNGLFGMVNVAGRQRDDENEQRDDEDERPFSAAHMASEARHAATADASQLLAATAIAD